MERSEVSERLTGVLVSELGLDASKIRDDAHFEEDLDVDSLGVVELLMALEDEFDGVQERGRRSFGRLQGLLYDCQAGGRCKRADTDI